MKKILVPTDFSETAKSAFHYAQQLADFLGETSIKLVHVFMPNVEAEYPNFIPPVTELMKVREQMLDGFVEEVEKEREGSVGTKIKVDKELLIGFPAEEISKISCDYDFVVMGTTGESDLLDKWFGSVSSGVAKRGLCPVLLIPKGVEFQGIHHILYAANYESAGREVIDKLMEFNRLFQATIHFVHVKDEREDYSKTMEELFRELFHKGEPEFAFEMEEIESNAVAEGLNDYAKAHHIDMVVMVSKHRSFWENLFHKSQTKRMCLTTEFPLMVYHVG